MVPGVFQILVIALVLLILFGRGRIAGSLGDIGRGVQEFRDGLRQGDPAEPVVFEAAEPQGTADK